MSTYVWSISYVQTNLAKFKGLLIKIKVIKGFSAKLKVLKDCNQIKGFKGSTRGPVSGMSKTAIKTSNFENRLLCYHVDG